MSGIWKDNDPKPVQDVRTGKVYRSRHKAGVDLAKEAGIDPKTKPSPWYKVNKVNSGRFLDVKTGRLIGPDGNITQF